MKESWTLIKQCAAVAVLAAAMIFFAVAYSLAFMRFLIAGGK